MLGLEDAMEWSSVMTIMNEIRPITEPYSPEVREELNELWEKEKVRLVESNVTLPRNVEPMAKRVFCDGVIAGLNMPPF